MVKIIANKKQLESIGIDYDISNLIGTYNHIFSDNWYAVEVEHKIGKYTFKNEFDIPKEYLEIL